MNHQSDSTIGASLQDSQPKRTAIHPASSMSNVDHSRSGGDGNSSGTRYAVDTDDTEGEQTPLLTHTSEDTQPSAGNTSRLRSGPNHKSSNSNDHVGVDMSTGLDVPADVSGINDDTAAGEQGHRRERGRQQGRGSLTGKLLSLKERLQLWNKTYPRTIKIVGLLLTVCFLILVISPLVAQRVLDRALVLEIQKTDISETDETGFQVSIQSIIRLDAANDGVFGLTGVIQKVFRPIMTIQPTILSLSLPTTDEKLQMAQFQVEEQQMPLGGILRLDISTHVLVTNATLMAEFFQSALQQSTVDLAVRGPVFTRLGSLWFMKLRLNLNVALDGLKGIQDATLASMALPGEDPGGGIAMSAVARIDNPSKVVSLKMGPISFGIFLPSKTDPDVDQYQIAEVKCTDLNLAAGQSNEIVLSGRLFHLDDWTQDSSKDAFFDSKSKKQLMLGELLSRFIRGDDSDIRVRALSSDPEVPSWLSEAFKGVVLEMAFPGSPTRDFIESLDMKQLQFGFSDAKDSALLNGHLASVLQLPPNITFPIRLLKMKPVALLRSPGGLNITSLEILDFLPTRSRQLGGRLEVEVELEDTRLVVAQDGLPEFYRFLNTSFTHEWIDLGIVGEATALVECGLGTFELGPIPFDVISHQRGFGGLMTVPPVLEKLDVVDSTKHSLTVKATLTLFNPSSISATLGDLSFLWSNLGYVIGMASVSNVHLQPGNNTIECIGMMDPSTDCALKHDPLCNPELAINASREFISKYISGDNSTTIDVLGYAGSTQIPLLKPMMSSFAITSHLPQIDQDFLISATMYIFSSKLELELQNPLDTVITILYINGTASFKGEKLGHILVDFEHDFTSPKPILIPANNHKEQDSGYCKTPKLPVVFDLLSVGYEALRRALGGSLEVDVVCHIKAKVGSMVMWVDFVKDGVQAEVRKGF
ncbi:hypothetical protein BGZ70_004338 [Mortierella alpina]|uniref:Tag1-like fifth Ig-like domain-containing protein n=1 Tax=Mortierella alpina TaxID=64518 RepID=A0A9P6LVN5_MORAP|nr:hypothetical protein BGZ70_004338 [Mortierella alpina]